MKVFIAGATGATGRQLTRLLLGEGHQVVAVVRSLESLPAEIKENKNLDLVQASILDLDDGRLTALVAGCGAVVSCLGHNLTFKGLFGPPRRLVMEAVKRLCMAIKAIHNPKPVRFILMNTTGNRNRDNAEQLPAGEKVVMGIMRLLLPPQRDNELAAEYLRTAIGQNDPAVEWAAVRPDSLINDEKVTAYTIHPSPVRSALFDPGKTSRINVAHFMMQLISDNGTWKSWKGQMPVIYNQDLHE